MSGFVQALHFKKASRKGVDLVVIHSAEIGESLEGAEALQRAAASDRRTAEGAPIVSSWHYAVDADSYTQSVREEDIAFHAPGVNPRSIGIELSGRARQSAAEWNDDFSRRMLELAASLVARICERWQIPARYVPAKELVDAVRGITLHRDVSAAFKRSDHWDPGPHFPVDAFIARVLGHMEPTAEPVLRRGSRGADVVTLQERLNSTAQVPPLVCDGDFGAKTLAAVVQFQRLRRLVSHGVVDAATWRELLL